jgi:hypothetical protein
MNTRSKLSFSSACSALQSIARHDDGIPTPLQEPLRQQLIHDIVLRQQHMQDAPGSRASCTEKRVINGISPSCFLARSVTSSLLKRP